MTIQQEILLEIYLDNKTYVFLKKFISQENLKKMMEQRFYH